MTHENTDAALIAEVVRAGEGGADAIERTGVHLRARFADSSRTGLPYPRRVVDALCRLEASDRPNASATGGTLIFSHVVEPLCDAFEPALADLYDMVFSQIIDFQRHLPKGRPLDEGLNAFGLHTEGDIRDRRLRIRHGGTPPVTQEPIRLIVVFSRVTIGADVAVTSVIIRRLRRRYPSAGILLVAPPRVRDLFAGETAIEVLDLPYPRRGSLAERLSTWPAMLKSIAEHMGPVPPDQVLFIDPDSRLTQLGLLPVSDPDNYRIFESRSYGSGGDQNLGELAARWADETLGHADVVTRPHVQLGARQAQRGRACIERFRKSGPERVIAVSFGVGGNEMKRAGPEFETRLLLALIGAGHAVVLDRGIDGDRDACIPVLESLEHEGLSVVGANADNLETLASGLPIRGQVLTWTGSLGAFSALIAASDLYIGYDSAFQHIAAALDTPVVAVVLGAPGPLFRHRWRPYSTDKVRVVPEVDTGVAPAAETLVTDTLAAAQLLLCS